MKIYTRKIPSTDLNDKEKKTLLATAEYQEVITESPFLYLTCDLPPPPLFIDEFRENIIPQVSDKSTRVFMNFITQIFSGQLVSVINEIQRSDGKGV